MDKGEGTPMAIYHLTAKMVKRADGQNAVGSAAYRSASKFYEKATGIIHDYRDKEGVAYTEIFAPDGAPAWVYDREALWNTAEAAEKRWDAQVAREIEIGLPIELNKSEQVALLGYYARREFVAKGMVSHIAMPFVT